MVPVLLVVTFIVFIIFRVIPGDPLMFILGSNPDPETIKIVSMKELLDIFPEMLKGQTSGRIVVDVNK